MDPSTTGETMEDERLPLARLALADPGLADEIGAALAAKPVPVAAEAVGFVVENTLAAMSSEISFGRAVGRGLSELIGEVAPRRIEQGQSMTADPTFSAAVRELLRELGIPE